MARIQKRLEDGEGFFLIVNVEIYHFALNFDLIDSAVVNSQRALGYNTNGNFSGLISFLEC